MTTADSYKDYAKDVGGLLKAARQKQSSDLSEAAQKIALSTAQLRNLENGDTSLFYNERYHLQAAQRYADLLKIKLPDFTPPVAVVTSEPATREAHNYAPLKQSGKKPWLITAAAFGVIALGILSMLESQQAPTTAVTAVEPPVSKVEELDPKEKTATTVEATEPVQQAFRKDSKLVNTSATWVQIVKKDGSKTDLRPKAGEAIEFDASTTAAIVFGRPATATLTVNGSTVDIDKFMVKEASSPRALVIIRDL